MKRTYGYTSAAEIKADVDAGITVYWSTGAYQVVKYGTREQYDIKCTLNGHCIGLTWMDGTTLNGKVTDFFKLEVA
jgi:hypothetical protein